MGRCILDPITIATSTTYYMEVTTSVVATAGLATTNPYPNGQFFDCAGCYTITYYSGSDLAFRTYYATPLPGALPLFASGLGALGLLGWRRKRKAKAA
jgi:hypothetical protein